MSMINSNLVQTTAIQKQTILSKCRSAARPATIGLAVAGMLGIVAGGLKEPGKSLLGVKHKDITVKDQMEELNGAAYEHPASGTVYSSDLTYNYDSRKSFKENAQEAVRVLGNNVSANVVDPIAEHAEGPVTASMALAALGVCAGAVDPKSKK